MLRVNCISNGLVSLALLRRRRRPHMPLRHDLYLQEKLGHHFSAVQWGVTQVCEFCNSVMWLMEAGLMCKGTSVTGCAVRCHNGNVSITFLLCAKNGFE